MRIAFMMEQSIGHRTFYLNLRRYISVDSRVDARWVEISNYLPNGLIEQSPLLPKPWKGVLRGAIETRSGLAHIPADLVFFNTQIPAKYVFEQLEDRPYILCTDITPLQYQKMLDDVDGKPGMDPFRGIRHYINRDVFQHAAHIIAWSNWARGSLIQDYGIPAEKITVIPPGVDLESWQPDISTPKTPSGPVKLLFVGGDFTRKGGLVLLEAFKKLEPGKFELHLVTRAVVPHVRGMFIYHGMVSNSAELVRLFRQCDLFVLPSLVEAFGIMAIEAMATGLPVIASRIGGLPEVIDDQKTGILVPPGDVDALAEAITSLAGDFDRTEWMRRNGRMAATERFSAERNAYQIVSLLLK